MRAKGFVWIVLLVFCLSAATPAAAAEGDKIVRTKPGLLGINVIGAVCGLLGNVCQVLLAIDVPPGSGTENAQLFLVRGLLTNTVTFLMKVLGLVSIEPDLPVSALQDDWDGNQASAAVLNALNRREPMDYHGTTVWEGYLDQTATGIFGLRYAHCAEGLTGAGTVAVIDTGVDLEHAALEAVLTPGYDFVSNAPGGGDTGADQASAAVLNGVHAVNGSTLVVIDQASAAVLNQPGNEGVGHGTMVAGAVHLVAPAAQIMPLRAFRSDGTAHTSDILRAIYYAVHYGADVLNMSFSRDTRSPELERALVHARNQGVVAVASAGNDGGTAPVYPAAIGGVLGVGSTTNLDLRSRFSNHGSQLVHIAAPGESIVTPYPGGTYAAATGTSFAAPLVAGAVSLLLEMDPTATPTEIAALLANAKRLAPRQDLNHGRLALRRAVVAAREMWPGAPQPEPVESCVSMGVDWTPVP
jgi:subtilisin family serine protease